MARKRKRPPARDSTRRRYKPLKCSGNEFELHCGGRLRLMEGGGKSDDFLLRAYTGKPVDVDGFEHPVIVDLNGAEFDKRTTPVLADHKVTNRIGHTLEQAIIPAGSKRAIGGKAFAGPSIMATGTRSSNMEIAKGMVADAKSGFPFQVSIGARIKKGYYVEESDTANVNGRVWDGPLIVAQRSVIRELSITVLGADNDTSVIAAKRKEKLMKFEAWLKSLGLKLANMSPTRVKRFRGEYAKLYASKPTKTKRRKLEAADPDEGDDDGDDDDAPVKSRKKKDKFLTAQQIEDNYLQAMSAQNERVERINEIAIEFSHVKEIEITDSKGKPVKLTLSQYKSKAIRDKAMTPELFELELRRCDYPSLEGGGPAIHKVDLNIDSKALECSILRYNGVQDSQKNAVTGVEYGLDAYYDDKVMEASHGRQYQIGNRINKLLAIQVAASGRGTSHLMHHDNDLMLAAHRAWTDIKAFSGASALSITNILENVMHKAALSAFESVEAQWRNIFGTMSVNDFRTHNLYRLDMNGQFKKVPTDGELKHVGVRDSKYTVSVDTYGCMIAVDRKTQIDDDLGMVLAKARGIGMLGGVRVEELVFVTLLANPGSFFASGNGNLISGGGSVLGIAGLQAAELKFNNQVINDKPISIAPSILVAGTNNKVLANRLYNESRMAYAPTTADFGNNPYAGRFRPVISGYLNNTAIKDQDGGAITGQSDNHWYLFTPPNSPQGNAGVVAFLNGRQTPYFDESQTQFNVPGGIQMRAYYDFGAAMHITQLALRSAGS